MTDPDLFNYLILPVLIFFARIADVSFGTMRIIFISRGLKYLAPFVGFFEISIWLIAISQVLKDGTPVPAFIGYALGFACGNYIGILIEERMALGVSVIRTITQHDATKLVNYLKNEGFRTTTVGAKGQYGSVNIILIVVKRKDIPQVLRSINKYNPKAFYTIEDVRSAGGTFFSPDGMIPKRGLGKFTRKGK
ncbi:uncharacterized protein YebE (UPF0316 family) [Methanomicrobium sp. W14]|uniref:DUF2179 domain-containing protein n=1 Tax=Methanomicrobium sp. W14 TaxID=2817839 RepID=UPI001AE8FC22|nr:DUF2179 domain-containing protein [Methanomicrobium sp. W14]MBP2133652.1 uncharacterized protein YebE (UPF0316 family) [Methanomicrobium sp. W14]